MFGELFEQLWSSQNRRISVKAIAHRVKEMWTMDPSISLLVGRKLIFQRDLKSDQKLSKSSISNARFRQNRARISISASEMGFRAIQLAQAIRRQVKVSVMDLSFGRLTSRCT